MTAIESTFLNLAYPPRLDLGPQLTHEQLLSSMQSTMARHKGGPVVVRVWV
jgi:cation transport protein ChaC